MALDIEQIKSFQVGNKTITQSTITVIPGINPTTGSNNLQKTFQDIIQLIKRCKDQNKTVIFSSHIMEEVNLLCDDLAIMHNGKILFNDTMQNFRALHGSHSLTEAFIDTVQNAK
jgi:sodium transport system ATP-binding protein